uniref:Putative secreted protein n=1 Tax=Amblyomma triste TaxID=251400 RepID=A0A023G2X8_AMBTT
MNARLFSFLLTLLSFLHCNGQYNFEGLTKRYRGKQAAMRNLLNGTEELWLRRVSNAPSFLMATKCWHSKRVGFDGLAFRHQFRHLQLVMGTFPPKNETSYQLAAITWDAFYYVGPRNRIASVAVNAYDYSSCSLWTTASSKRAERMCVFAFKLACDGAHIKMYSSECRTLLKRR